MYFMEITETNLIAFDKFKKIPLERDYSSNRIK